MLVFFALCIVYRCEKTLSDSKVTLHNMEKFLLVTYRDKGTFLFINLFFLIRSFIF